MAKIKILKGNDFYLSVTPYKINDGNLMPFDIKDYKPLKASTDKQQLTFEVIKEKPLMFKVDLKHISNDSGLYDFEITLKSNDGERQIRYSVKDLIEVIEYGKPNYNNFEPFFADEQNFITVEFKVMKPPYLE